MGSEPLTNKLLGLSLIDRSPGSTHACVSIFVHGGPPPDTSLFISLCFCRKPCLIFQGIAWCAQRFLFTEAHTKFSFLRKLALTRHNTEFSLWLYTPLAPGVLGRQCGAVKRAYNFGPVGPQPIISLPCNPEVLYKAPQVSLFISLNSIMFHWMMKHHIFHETSNGQCILQAF